MKSTYKLLGLEWDHAPLPQECPAFSTEKEVQNWNVDRNLFDLQIYEDGVPVTKYDMSRDLKIAISEYAPDSEVIVCRFSNSYEQNCRFKLR